MEKLAVDFLSEQTGPLAILIGVLAALCWLIPKTVKGAKAVWLFLTKLVTVVEDLFGTPAREGIDEGKPGIMARLAGHDKELKAIRYEVQYNSGGSLKDAVRNTNQAVATLREELAAHIASTQGNEQTVTVNVAPAA